MFTGIVEEKGQLETIKQVGQGLRLKIKASIVTQDVSTGDSISVNGVCLTVTEFTEQSFSVDVIPETFRGSALSTLQSQSYLNLERAMAANGRFGGHFVSGHVDAVGKIASTWTEDNALYVEIAVPKENMQYLTMKGSISVDGTSLTVFNVKEESFVISLIPETRKATILGEKKKGDVVNIEYDMLAKYMERLLDVKGQQTNTGITKQKLTDYGF
ncbi:riboflavin synthase [Saliterribacillus persicus]|uniref:Riboflavin synthase n=1 Tax=Saliterribacillus persicus TaxID=930114 RepID=A0A368XYK7_9BACI|nr:riboflavin synthase [Saliterribacillus persicus]RCW73073.1 riboflavin synthase alpha chain [Saliterribacillus persicus]